jgi:hypothetical protein
MNTFVLASVLLGLLAQPPSVEGVQCTVSAAPEKVFSPTTVHQPPSTCFPTAVAWWAIPSDTGHYTMYRVGGGCPCPCLADPPMTWEGTWGWDYVGHWFRPDAILGWWHGRRCQGGAGAYQTDGPTLNNFFQR